MTELQALTYAVGCLEIKAIEVEDESTKKTFREAIDVLTKLYAERNT